jgi:hypothetical protein
MENMEGLITYDITEGAIAKLQADCMGLKVRDFNDKEGFELCRKARIDVKAKRVAVEKRRKELKEESLKFGRMVDSRANELKSKLVEIETHLQAQEDVVLKELERRKAEEERKKKERIEARAAELAKYGASVPFAALETMPDEKFSELLAAEKSRFEKQEEERRIERERLAALEAERKEQEAKARAQEEENRKLREELLAKEREERARAERELAEQRKAQEEERRKREELEAQQRKEQQEREQKEAEARARAEREIADKKLFAQIQKDFPTLESAWVEIARLVKEIRGRK